MYDLWQCQMQNNKEFPFSENGALFDGSHRAVWILPGQWPLPDRVPAARACIRQSDSPDRIASQMLAETGVARPAAVQIEEPAHVATS